MKLKCLIVDDEPIAQNILRSYVKDTPNLEIYKICSNAMEAMPILKENFVDILFLDIEMPKISGLSFLKTLSNPPATILTTAYRQFALEGFELNVVDYLLKPFSFERFLIAVNKIEKAENQPFMSNIKTDTKEYDFFKVNKKNVKVFFEDILFFEGLSNYVVINTFNEKLIIYSSLSMIENRIFSKGFVRIHRSYIVNTQNLKAYGKDYVEIGDKQLSIGNTYKKNFEKIINEIL